MEVVSRNAFDQQFKMKSLTSVSDSEDIEKQNQSSQALRAKETSPLSRVKTAQNNLLRVPTFAGPQRVATVRFDPATEIQSPHFILTSNDSRPGSQRGNLDSKELRQALSSQIFRRMSLFEPLKPAKQRGLSPSQASTRQVSPSSSRSPKRSKGLISQVRHEQQTTRIKKQKTLLEIENDRASRLSLKRLFTSKTDSSNPDGRSITQDLQKEVDINGLNAFHRAAADHNINLIMELMEIFPEADYNPKVWLDVPNKHGITPLQFACMYRHKGKLKDRQKFIEFLLENGADPNSCNKYTYFTPLHWACRYGDSVIVSALLRGGATPFTPDSKGYFPIDLAGLFNHSEVIKTLVDYSIKKFEALKEIDYEGPEVDISQINNPPRGFKSVFQFRNEFLLSSFYATKLLYWASMEQSVEFESVEKILTEMEAYPEGCLPFMFRQTPLHAAALSGNEAKLQLMIDDFFQRKKSYSFLQSVQQRLQVSLLRKFSKKFEIFRNIKLIERNAPYRKHCIIGDSHHNSFLQVLNVKRLSQVKQIYFDVFWTQINKMHQDVRMPNVQDFNGNSPLHLSALKNNVRCTQLLTEHYAASIDLRNIDGIMAKDIGAWYPETHNCFMDYYNIVDTMIQQSSSHQHQFNLDIIKTRDQKNRRLTKNFSMSSENMLCAKEEDMQALFRRIVSQEEAKGILSKELMLSRPYIPQVPLVAMKFNISTPILREKLNSILRQLNSSCFQMSVFKGVDADTIFVVLNLAQDDLEKEATAIGFPAKLHSISAKAPFRPENKGNIEPFLPKDKQKIMVQKIDTLFNIQDLLRQRVLVSIFPLHDFNGLYYLEAVKKGSMVSRIKVAIEQYFFEDFKNTKFSNLIAYKNYFGEKMCILHAFFRFYTVWFAIPAFASIILCFYQLYFADYDVIACIVFAFCISIWSTIFVEMWKRKEYHIQTQWGIVTSESSDNDTTLNPDFIGYNKFSWSNYGVGKKGKFLKARVILALNMIASMIMIGTTVAAYLAIKKYAKFNYYIKGLGISAITGLLNVIYKEMAAKFVVWENHKYLKDKDGSFMLKIVAFSTINTNLPIVYTILFPDVNSTISKPEISHQSRQILAELGPQAQQAFLDSVSHTNLYSFLYGIVLGSLTAKILSAIFTRYFYRFAMFHFYRYLYFRKMRGLGRVQQQSYQDAIPGLNSKALSEIQLKESLYIYKGVFSATTMSDSIGKVNPAEERPTSPSPVYQRLIFNSENDKRATDCSEHATYLLDAVEINSIMPVKTELMKTSDMTEQLQLIGLALLYAGICPIGTAIVFVYFILDDVMARYTDCYCMRRPLQENQMSLGNWTFVVEFIVGFVTISNSAVLFLVSTRFKDFLTNTLHIAPKNHLWFVGIFEHFLLMMIILTKVFISDFPRPLKKYYENQKKELDRLFHEQKKDKYKVLQRENKRLSEVIQSDHSHSPKQLIYKNLKQKHASLVDFFNLNNAQKSNILMVSTLEQTVLQNVKQRLLRETFLRVERNILESKMSKLNHFAQAVTVACASCHLQRAEVYCDECGKNLCIFCRDKSTEQHQHSGKVITRRASQPVMRHSSQPTQLNATKATPVWKKLEYFDFPVDPFKAVTHEKIQGLHDNLTAIYLELNDISLFDGSLDLASIFIDKNLSALPKEISFKFADKHKKRFQDVTAISDLIQTDKFNDEERFLINRLVFFNVAKDGHLVKVETLIQQLDTLQNGSFEERLSLWLWGVHMLDVRLNEGINQPQQFAKNPKQNFQVPRHLFRSTVLASYPQELNCGLAVDSVVVTLFVTRSTMKFEELKSAIQNNEQARLLMECILQKAYEV